MKLGYLPIFEKENAFDFLEEYDEVAIIDSDIYIRPGSPSVFEELKGNPFAAMQERDTPSTEKHKKKLQNFSKQMFFPLGDVAWSPVEGIADFHNMGVMVLGQGFRKHLKGMAAKEWLQQPQFQRFIDGVGFLKWSCDQSLLGWWLRKNKIPVSNLDWKWNTMYGAAKQNALGDAYFIHFWLSDKLPTSNVSELLKNPQKYYWCHS